ncbi:MAG: glutathione S-transferase family protein [Pseudomonadota bacterium]
MSITLQGYKYSVYTWIVRACLHEKNATYDYLEIDPFSDNVPGEFLELNPFGNVPVLSHGSFKLYETASITAFIDRKLEGTSLHPESVEALARMQQIIAIVDTYGYWPMIRQVFAQCVFAPAFAETPQEDQIKEGLERSKTVLRALETISAEGLQLTGKNFSLADIHLGPMLSYFTQAEEGARMLTCFPALQDWWESIRERDCFTATKPDLPGA